MTIRGSTDSCGFVQMLEDLCAEFRHKIVNLRAYNPGSANREDAMPSDAFLAFVDRCQSVVGGLESGEIAPDSLQVLFLLRCFPTLTEQRERDALESTVVGLAATIKLRWGSTDPCVAAIRRCQLARAALDWIEAGHTFGSFRATQLAKALGVSRWHLGRTIKQCTGQSIRSHLLSARVSHAEFHDVPAGSKRQGDCRTRRLQQRG